MRLVRRSYEPRAGLADGCERARAVARLQLDRTHGLAHDGRVVPEPESVEGGLLHAVVRGESDDHDPLDRARAEQVVEAGAAALPAREVLDAEAGVAVLQAGRLADPVADDLQLRVELRAPRVAHTMHGPLPAMDLEMRCRRRVPILRVHD